MRTEPRPARTGGRAAGAAARDPGAARFVALAPERLDEGDFAFRLGPRINAAGRLYRADAGVELMLTADQARAKEIAAELERANRERRAIEREVLEAAEEAAAGSPTGWARRRVWCSRATGGTPAWSGSSPLDWPSATTGPWC